jgi:Outer membrane protein beta-barrel domain
MTIRGLLTAGALGLATFVPVPSARADVLFTPFVGANLGGSAASPLADFVGDPSKTTFGGSLALMSGGVFGVEADVGYTPRFFGTDVELGGIPVSLVRNNVLTAMVNVTAGVPLQGGGGAGIRPYAVGGIGLIRQQLSAAAGLVNYDLNDVGYNVGGGVVLFVSRNVGIRGDVRHFRTLGGNTVVDLIDLQPGAFNYTRATVGVTFRY